MNAHRKSETTPLDALRKPAQTRAQQTASRILDAAAALLEETGFEDLSTNAICRHAGVTPPALYRYWPNKHAVLAALAERLLGKQNERMAQWASNEFNAGDLEESYRLLLTGQLEVTLEQPGGLWITRALRASPTTASILDKSSAELVPLLISMGLPGASTDPDAPLGTQVRLGIEMGYAALELALNAQPAERTRIIKESAFLLVTLHRTIMSASNKS